ncbi:hypothetical protein Tco_0090811 [Tanacetum coccineum]
MEKTQSKPKKLLPYGMLLTRLFKHVVSVFPELAIDRYISHDRVMHPLAPHYERKTRSDRGKKIHRESNASSSFTTLNHPYSSHLLDDTFDENDDESFHSNSSSPSQNISSSSNVEGLRSIGQAFKNMMGGKRKNLESRCIHEGQVVFDNFADLNYVRSMLSFVEFECLLKINDQICPHFILEFYSQYQINYSDEGEMFIEFVIQNQFFSYSLEEFAQILDIPCEGACVFTDKWSLDELAYGVPTDGPYQTNPPSPNDIISSIRHPL